MLDKIVRIWAAASSVADDSQVDLIFPSNPKVAVDIPALLRGEGNGVEEDELN